MQIIITKLGFGVVNKNLFKLFEFGVENCVGRENIETTVE